MVPRLLLLVEEVAAGPLGVAAGRRPIRSVRSAYEKKPWKDLAGLEGMIESEFIRPLYLGETVLPFRLLTPAFAVVPWDGSELCSGERERLELYPGLSLWWRKAEEIWLKHRSSERLSLIDRVNYHNGLLKQFPVQPRRIVYSASGMHLSAAIVVDTRGVIEHSLYWASPGSVEEAEYLCAILNSAAVTQLVRPLMSYGKDERHIDKYVWQLPIPEFDPGNIDHSELATLGRTAGEEVRGLQLEEGKHFAALRRTIREHFAKSEAGKGIEKLVKKLLE